MPSFLVIPGLVFALILSGCASAPEFRPSLPPEEAPSLAEGLHLCHEYRMPRVGSRPIALKPYANCVDSVATAPGSRGLRARYRVFQQELRLLYDLEREETWSDPVAEQIDSAVQAALRALWREAGQGEPCTERERDLLRAFLPRTADALSIEEWKPHIPGASELAADPRLERLRARANGRDWPIQARAELKRLQSELEELAAVEKLAPGDARLASARRKHGSRVAELDRKWTGHARD